MKAIITTTLIIALAATSPLHAAAQTWQQRAGRATAVAREKGGKLGSALKKRYHRFKQFAGQKYAQFRQLSGKKQAAALVVLIAAAALLGRRGRQVYRRREVYHKFDRVLAAATSIEDLDARYKDQLPEALKLLPYENPARLEREWGISLYAKHKRRIASALDKVIAHVEKLTTLAKIYDYIKEMAEKRPHLHENAALRNLLDEKAQHLANMSWEDYSAYHYEDDRALAQARDLEQLIKIYYEKLDEVSDAIVQYHLERLGATSDDLRERLRAVALASAEGLEDLKVIYEDVDNWIKPVPDDYEKRAGELGILSEWQRLRERS